ncbi:DUF412 family protein [Shewanella intestini]|uniref:UPF0208 membrane protein YfbV n=2 Tax=Shewanellaceae TaxID=267890 RepID=A0ABS5I0P2_9GAMM|nr:DUF412 family protein [Shewanella intestini]MRG34479.1 DUF412 family protein [Shewanella sp. XMDDZSB0408]
MKIWPMVKQISFYFPEYRVIKATRLSIVAMPVIALLTVIIQTSVLSVAFLPQSIAMGLFFISIPIQGFVWLGWRASHPLPLSLFDWTNKLSQQLVVQGVACPPLTSKACYMDMANILKLAFERLDNSYWDDI